MIAARPAPGESLAAWAKRCAEQERLTSRSERGTRLLALIERVLSWPSDRVSVIHGPGPKYETYARVDAVQFWLLEESGTDHLLVAGQHEWFEIDNAADLGEMMRSGLLQGWGQ
jgi:hypothetical protein